ncbi:MAG TPA: HEAT repeat domain-containing protein [Methylomirabilota bacterium]|nr:HEAT repeat domain-containing protein [Methylomirabilota bacterium]
MWSRIVVAVLSAATLFAQNGDKPGEAQEPPKGVVAPPAPPLKPDEALKSFKLPPGFVIEVVAAEPLVEAPVAMQFDPDGRLWVLEMRGFMPNVDGRGEDEPLGRVVTLEDTDDNGVMDKRTVFIDGLVMARAISLVNGGLLIGEPPFLWHARDTDGDGKADTKDEVAANYGSQVNPEHTSNGLLWALDNWIYSANHTVRYRNIADNWEKEETVFRGQWGITQDDYGRLFYNSNSDQLRGDLIPAHYLRRNPNHAGAGVNYPVAKDQTTWPARVTPGINRGYQSGMLRDGKLARFTAACGPVIYRGSTFPKEFYGSAFVAEPSGNFVRCNLLTEKDGVITATNALKNDEFLTSQDERFRPVNLHNGPDGNLYVVDMYRGVLQHRIYLTTYLRNQALSRGLDKPLDMGRIYRVRPANAAKGTAPKLAKATAEELVRALENPNGWWRDTAQQVLVERKEERAVGDLKKLALTAQRDASAIHALWTLQGMGKLDSETALGALKSKEPMVRVHALRLSEPFLTNNALPQVLQLKGDPDAVVQWQLALTLGEAKDPSAFTALLELLQRNEKNPFIRDAVMSSVTGRESEVIAQLKSVWSDRSNARNETLKALARAVAASRNGRRVGDLLEIAAKLEKPWQTAAVLDGIAAIIPPPPRGRPAPKAKAIQLLKEPAGYSGLKAHKDPAVQKVFAEADPILVWPDKPGVSPDDIVRPLNAEQQKRFDAGKELYLLTCGACHQPHGNGQEGLAPPLTDVDWVLGPPGRLARIILHGVRGPINVKGKVYEMEMPPLNVLDDEQIASLMTYVRREWTHGASPVAPEEVAKVRKETESRQEAWTEAELLKINN